MTIPNKNHNLKTDPIVFKASLIGHKNFEIRFNDRDFRVGDKLTLLETKYSGKEMSEGKPLSFTKRKLHKVVQYVLCGKIYGLMEGWVILDVKDN